MGCVLGLFLLGLIFIMIRNIWIILGKGKDGIFESGWESDRVGGLGFIFLRWEIKIGNFTYMLEFQLYYQQYKFHYIIIKILKHLNPNIIQHII